MVGRTLFGFHGAMRCFDLLPGVVRFIRLSHLAARRSSVELSLEFGSSGFLLSSFQGFRRTFHQLAPAFRLRVQLKFAYFCQVDLVAFLIVPCHLFGFRLAPLFLQC